jgi:septal ring-binding cell division protein DamX
LPPGFAAAHARLRKGEYKQAAHDFLGVVKPGAFTVQLIVACSDETLQKTVAGVAAETWFAVPTRYQRKECYRVCWGVYESETQARGAVKQVPEYFTSRGAKPRVIPTAQALR